ncbi:hypothetical protein H6F67_11410 [Microcoleus sp. FACHB-1515]|uniref:hypothetical protein n=1 Tax=Cyanophyceae TaxID=3028117 RepID=UPI001686FE89|nr:hypothetical protein [Microcoleus sp. FACHB-1515]MBD2090463.1 hypothetical protein [Microcoleus sp. FACHB-1515]
MTIVLNKFMIRTRANPSRLGSAIDALCVAPLLLIAIAASIAVDDGIEAISTLVSSAFGSD